MEHDFIVRITPKEMQELFRSEKYNIRGYEFLGIKEKGDFDPRKHPASEHDTFYVTPCLYRIRLRKELTSYLKGTYKSWQSVEKAMKRRALKPEPVAKTKYRVTVAVTLHDVIEVDAENLRDAEENARYRFENGLFNVNADSAKAIEAKFDAMPMPKGETA